MSNKEMVKYQTVESLQQARNAFGENAKLVRNLDNAANLPPAFGVVSRDCRDIGGLLNLMMERIESADQQDYRTYGKIQEVAEHCIQGARCLESVLSVVVRTEDAALRLRNYRQAAAGGTKSLEQVMGSVLGRLGEIVREPFASEEHANKVREMLDEVENLQPSWKPDAPARVVMENTHSGSQFYNSGTGDQNSSHDHSTQINGATHGANFHFGSEPSKRRSRWPRNGS